MPPAAETRPGASAECRAPAPALPPLCPLPLGDLSSSLLIPASGLAGSYVRLASPGKGERTGCLRSERVCECVCVLQTQIGMPSFLDRSPQSCPQVHVIHSNSPYLPYFTG